MSNTRTAMDTIKRWDKLAIGVLIMLCLGLIYGWSIFVAPLEAEFGWVRSETSLAFTLCISFFCVGGLVAGIITGKKSPRFTMVIAAMLLLIGFLGVSRLNSLFELYLFYGVFCGSGVGAAYNVVVNTITKWFPDKRGLASGILLMGYGLGGMLLGSIASALIVLFGWRTTFLVLGIIFASVILMGSIKTVLPPEDFYLSVNINRNNRLNENPGFDPLSMLKHSSFWFFFLWNMLLAAGGLTLVGNAAPIAAELGASIALSTLASGMISFTNGIGRVLMGHMYDSIGRKNTMTVINMTYILAIGLIIAAYNFRSLSILLIGYAAIGLPFGGGPTTTAAFVNDFYGTKYFAVNFGIMNLTVIVSSIIGPYVSGIIQSSTGSYMAALFVILAFGSAGIVSSLFIKKPSS